MTGARAGRRGIWSAGEVSPLRGLGSGVGLSRGFSPLATLFRRGAAEERAAGNYLTAGRFTIDMRLPARKVYRAFRELDRFADGQCEIFVHAARRGTARRIRRGILQAIAALVGLACGWAATLGVLYALYHEDIATGRHNRSDLAFYLMAGMWMALGLGGAALGWFLSRDLLLRWRIRRVLGTRGSCAMCGYGLTGLPFVAEFLVVCPECGYRFGAEPNLGEVVLDAASEKRFLPSPDFVPRLLRWLTPKLKKQLIRWSVRGAVAVLALAVLSAGGYEWFIRRQAAIAQRARVGAEALVDFVARDRATGEEGAPDAWESFDAALDAVSDVNGRTWQVAVGEDPDAPQPDFYEVFQPKKSENQRDAARVAAGRALAVAAIDDYRLAGVFDRLDEMARRRRAVRVLILSPGQVLTNMVSSDPGSARRTCRMNQARMRLAADAGDLREFISAFECNLALVRMLGGQRLSVPVLTAAGIRTGTFWQVRELLGGQPDLEWVEAICGAVERQPSGISYRGALEAGRIVALDSLAWYFSDPDRVRGGRFAPALGALTGKSAAVTEISKPVGTYAQNRDAVAALFDRAIARIGIDPWERGTESEPSVPDLAPIEMYTRWVLNPSFADQDRLTERALEVSLALERFRCEHRGYPASLDELVPHYLRALPLDPWSGRALGYRREVDLPDGRPAYLLYSVGVDGEDNGGKAAPSGREFDAINGEAPGTDYSVSPKWDRQVR